jgi:hypothetical protein
MTSSHRDAPLKNNDYARHVQRTWIDTHGQAIRTDPEIYLPGELAAEESGSDSDSDSEQPEEAAGRKRKMATRGGRVYSAKAAKTRAGATASAAALTVIDDRRPDLTLIDCPVDECISSHPYGRHACLFIEVKVDPDKKPNPRSAVRFIEGSRNLMLNGLLPGH